MQGVVYGSLDVEDERLETRFDFDQCFGTAINRFCTQAIVDKPITPYGKGLQKRGFLPLCDSMQCLTIAIENPPETAEYRVFNQFEEVYNVTELANNVKKAAAEIGIKAQIRNLTNPRTEAEEHYYNPDHKHLIDLGYKPTTNIHEQLKILLRKLLKHKDRIEPYAPALVPDINWDGTRKKSKYL